MPISFGRKSKLRTELDAVSFPRHPDCRLATKASARLFDLRNPDMFQVGFIPGSYNLPDAACIEAARRGGLFADRQIYLLADDIEQLHLFPEASLPVVSGNSLNPQIIGWFGPDAIYEWRKTKPEIGCFELLDADALLVRMAAGNILRLQVENGVGAPKEICDASALRFQIDNLPMSLDGLPVETAICVTSESTALASFAASLLWNFGFHNMARLTASDRPAKNLFPI